jgi:GNAT superfamily N-acetyltransferase
MAFGSVGRPGWDSFAVFEEDVILAVGGLHVLGRNGQLFGGATLPRARRRGAQSALIAARAAAAREAGCEWPIGEAGAEDPGERSDSLRNVLRAGMTVRYHQENWIWRAADREDVPVLGCVFCAPSAATVSRRVSWS